MNRVGDAYEPMRHDGQYGNGATANGGAGTEDALTGMGVGTGKRSAGNGDPGRDDNAYGVLGAAAGLGSFLGSGTILALSSTLALWRAGLGLSASQVGAVSAILTFAFAIGSFCGGFIAQRLGLTRTFIIDVIVCVAALAICTVAPNFAMLALGIGLAGIAVGVDLPVSISVITHDVPDESRRTHLVSRTQVLWSAGILCPYVLALIVSPLGFLGARIVFGTLTAVALLTALWRVLDPRIARLHREAAARERTMTTNRAESTTGENAGGMGMIDVLRSVNVRTGRPYAVMFAAIALFYVMWNLMANTINQFQTYLLVSQHASQTQAMIIGIVAAVLCVLGGVAYGRVPKGVWRDRLFWAGALAQVLAMVIMAVGGSMLFTAVAVMLFQFFCNFAGEMNAKVWTQETFPVAVSAEAQSLILGIARIPCAFASLVLPSLLVPGMITVALWSFVAVAVLSGVFGGMVVVLGSAPARRMVIA
ncbi:MFS transporter [Bifidobacterium callimiconis]|uniref:Sugar transporter n=1 Tax=Bifidobacterium callimiconis TaxID=2306973 RepID=A0A430FDM0_9BIFI|nr:MFS transporter [Bifidobacterium callimiconis]MBT1177809.1 MFS transporter [Bifidobacterium callimiconis]RSX50965.1 sugar transporter [Bifidobacterium callimiconis]